MEGKYYIQEEHEDIQMTPELISLCTYYFNYDLKKCDEISLSILEYEKNPLISKKKK